MKKKRKVSLFQINVQNGFQFDLIKHNPPLEMIDVVWKESVEAIKESINKNKKSANIFILNNGIKNFYLTIPKNKWKYILQTKINQLSKEDKFEECIELQNYLNKC